MRYCPNCGKEVDVRQENDYGLVCDYCHDNFWGSQTLPEEYQLLGLKTLKELRSQ